MFLRSWLVIILHLFSFSLLMGCGGGGGNDPDTPVNRAPVLEPIENISVLEDEEINFSPLVSDPDGDELVVSYSGWMTTSSYTTRRDDQGEHVVRVSVSDGVLTTTQNVTVTVTDVPADLGLSFPPIGDEHQRLFTADKANDLDVGLIRFAEDWAIREQTEGIYNWAPLDQKLAWAEENNFSILLTIQSTGPVWWCDDALTNDKSCVFTAEGKTAFGDYVNALFQRYPNKFAKVQFGNEWVVPFWFIGSGEQFVEYHNIVHDALIAHSPMSAMVLGGFATPILQQLAYCQERTITYVDDHGSVYDAAMRESFCSTTDYSAGHEKVTTVLSGAQYDYLDVHLYDVAEEWSTYLAAIQSLETQYHPVVVSEFGGPHPVNEIYSDEYQAIRLKTYLETIATMPVEQAYYYHLVDDTTSFHKLSGLIRATETRLMELKPAYYVFKHRDDLPMSTLPVSTAKKQFASSFETADDFSGFHTVEVNHMSSASHELSTEQVKTGNYAHKAWMYDSNEPSTPTENNNHRAYPTVQLQTTSLGVFTTPVLIEFWVWLDMSFSAGEWFSFATLDHTLNTEWDPVLVNLSTDGFVHLMHVPTNGEQEWNFQTSDVSFPMEEWVKLSVCLHFDQTQGFAKVWQNDVLVSTAPVHKGNGEFTQAHFGLYAPPSMSSGTVFNDDLKITEMDCM